MIKVKLESKHCRYLAEVSTHLWSVYLEISVLISVWTLFCVLQRIVSCVHHVFLYMPLNPRIML